MNAKRILNFLSELTCNNNREWFALHKGEYEACKADFELFVAEWIERMSKVKPELKYLTPKDCMWRIYRDTRFSPDKTPYKDHFGAFLAQKGGKKSRYAGYYVHLQPNGACMFAAGMWCPDPDILKAQRMAILDNYEELEQIMDNQSFRRYFTDFDTDYMLKKVPAGFPQDFEHADWLKLKTFTISRILPERLVTNEHFIDALMDISVAAQPLNDFLNYTLEEMSY